MAVRKSNVNELLVLLVRFSFLSSLPLAEMTLFEARSPSSVGGHRPQTLKIIMIIIIIIMNTKCL